MMKYFILKILFFIIGNFKYIYFVYSYKLWVNKGMRNVLLNRIIVVFG